MFSRHRDLFRVGKYLIRHSKFLEIHAFVQLSKINLWLVVRNCYLKKKNYELQKFQVSRINCKLIIRQNLMRTAAGGHDCSREAVTP